MKQNLLRYYMNHWWHSDPDALMVRRQKERTLDQNITLGLLTDVEALTSTLNQYIGGGLVCATEPMATIDDDRLMLLRHILPALPVQATPRDMFSGGRYPSVVDVAVKDGRWHTVCLRRDPPAASEAARLLGRKDRAAVFPARCGGYGRAFFHGRGGRRAFAER